MIDYNMALFILHVVSTREIHISPKAEDPRANMGRGLIWHVIWKKERVNYYNFYRRLFLPFLCLYSTPLHFIW
jgi:hypothetical protein